MTLKQSQYCITNLNITSKVLQKNHQLLVFSKADPDLERKRTKMTRGRANITFKLVEMSSQALQKMQSTRRSKKFLKSSFREIIFVDIRFDVD